MRKIEALCGVLPKVMRFEQDFRAVLVVESAASAGFDLSDSLDRRHRDAMACCGCYVVALSGAGHALDCARVCVTSRCIRICGVAARIL